MVHFGAVRIDWTGGPGGTGLTTLYVRGGTLANSITAGQTTGIINAVDALLGSWMPYVPSGYVAKVRADVDWYQDLTNELRGTTTANTPVGSRSSSGTGAYAAGVGARIVWSTGAVVAGRRQKGSTFIVPLVASAYEADGTILGTAVTAFQNAAGTCRAALTSNGTPLVVYSRPQPLKGRDGQGNDVTGSSVPDKVSWLRSRRT